MASRGSKVDQNSNLTFRARSEVEVEVLLTKKWKTYVDASPGRNDDLATWNAFLQTLDPGERKIINLFIEVTATGPMTP